MGQNRRLPKRPFAGPEVDRLRRVWAGTPKFTAAETPTVPTVLMTVGTAERAGFAFVTIGV